MKRLITVVSLLMLFVLLGGQTFTADIYDPTVEGDDHPWEEWEGGNGQGSCYQAADAVAFTATSFLPVDILINSDLLLIKAKKILWKSERSSAKYSSGRRGNSYIDRARKASLK